MPVEATGAASVTKLVDIRRDIRSRIRKRWWQSGEITKDRWTILEDLANLGTREAKEHLERALVKEIRKTFKELPYDEVRIGSLRQQLWNHLEKGELDTEQHSRLLELLSNSVAEQAGKEFK